MVHNVSSSHDGAGFVKQEEPTQPECHYLDWTNTAHSSPVRQRKIQLNQVDYYSNKYFYSKTKDFVVWIKLAKKLLFQNFQK